MKSVTSANVDISKFLSPKDVEEIRTRWKCDDFVLLKMLQEGAHADITLTTQDGSVKAHRSVLASVSPIFNAMFQYDMKELLTSTVNIEGLQLFLLLLYATTELKLDKYAHEMLTFWSTIGFHLAELCKAFSKYQVKRSGVRSVLESALVSFLRVDNCLDYYDILFDLKSDIKLYELFKVTENYIVGNYNRVVRSPFFLEELVRKPRQAYRLIKSAEPPDRRAPALQCFNASKAKFHT